MADHNLEYSIRAFLISLLLLLLGQTPLINPFRNAYFGISNPIQLGFYSVGGKIRDELDFFLTLRKLAKLNFEYENQIRQLTLELSKLKETQKENEILKEQLNLELAEEVAITEVKVLGRDTIGGRAVISVDRGTESGITVGKVVVLGNNLLGYVEDTSTSRSKIRLITDALNRVAVLDQDSKDRARGLVRGRYATTLVMEKIYQDEEVSIGDMIVTSGEDEKYPKGLIVGKVARVLEEEDKVFKSAEIETVVDFLKLERIFIIK